jgi:hypothetical protein
VSCVRDLPQSAAEFFERLSDPHHSVYFNNNVGDR